MKISDLYRHKLTLVDGFLEKAARSEDDSIRAHFKELAWGFQSQAGLISHCLAYFGDQCIEEIPFLALLHEAKSRKCLYENPWVRGLRIIEREHLSASLPAR